MRNVVAALVMTALIVGAGCKNSSTSTTSGTPNPPFQGDIPQDVYKFTGEIGTYGGTMVLSEPDDPKTFNIILASDNATADILWYNIFRCPVDYRNGGDPPDFDPGLCTKWEASPDAKTWTFYLRRGVRWSDGEPFNADDLVFTYKVMIDKNVLSPAREVFIEGKEENGEPIFPDIEKLDDYTVRFKLHSPNGSFLEAIYNLWLIPKHKWEQPWQTGRFASTMTLTEDLNNVAGLGPYRIKEYVSGQRVVLERNPYFWKVDSKGQRLPYLDRMVFVIAPNFNTIFSKFKAGELSVLWRVRASEYKDAAAMQAAEGSDIVVQDTGVSCDTNALIFNQSSGSNPQTGRPYVAPWKLNLYRNQKFRQAVSYAIDRVGLANTVFSGRGEPYSGFISPGDRAWYTGTEMQYPFDPAKARQLLAEIGLKDTNGDGFVEDAQGHTAEFSILVNANNSQRTETASLI